MGIIEDIQSRGLVDVLVQGPSGFNQEDINIPTAQDTFSTGEIDPTVTGTTPITDLEQGVENFQNTASTFTESLTEGLLNIGPDWLDEATGVVVVLVVIGAVLWLVRPLLELLVALVEATSG